jgi:hypothetical protein
MFWGLLDNFAVIIAYNEKDRLVVQIWLIEKTISLHNVEISSVSVSEIKI